jgi:hypothetical protein
MTGSTFVDACGIDSSSIAKNTSSLIKPTAQISLKRTSRSFTDQSPYSNKETHFFNKKEQT